MNTCDLRHEPLSSTSTDREVVIPKDSLIVARPPHSRNINTIQKDSQLWALFGEEGAAYRPAT